MKGYLSVQQTADKWGVSVRWVNQYILEGRIQGCERFGRVWAVPADAVKPGRLTPGGNQSDLLLIMPEILYFFDRKLEVSNGK